MPQPLEIVVNRRGGVPVREQLVTQLEMKILDGTLSHGQRLPSVRTLARSLKVHHNTVSAAYQDLKASGHVELQRGSGVFVCRGGATGLPDARGLDEMIRLALQAAFVKGFSGVEVRAAVERWLAAVPPERVLVVDPSLEMGELLAHEIRQALKVPATAATLEAVAREPALASGALGVVLPYHVEAYRRILPSGGLEVVTLEVPLADRQVVRALPEGSIVLFVSHSPTVLPFASGFLSSLRGDEILVEVRLLADTREWRRLLRAADLVVADALSVEPLRRAGARELLELLVVPTKALERVREGLRVVAPKIQAGPRAARGSGARD
jgi:DNA-binding transcriptional regulator YhcF (GntR family)